jgi:tetratricopeptide (TPR) repeat protein
MYISEITATNTTLKENLGPIITVEFENNEHRDQAAVFEQICVTEGKISTLHYKYAQTNIHEHKGDFTKALTIYNEIIQNHPNCAEAYFYRGLALIKANQNSPAMNDFSTAIRLEISSGSSNLDLLSDIYYKRGKLYSTMQDNHFKTKAMMDFLRVDSNNSNYEKAQLKFKAYSQALGGAKRESSLPQRFFDAAERPSTEDKSTLSASHGSQHGLKH